MQGNAEDSISRLKKAHKNLHAINIIKELDDTDRQLLLHSVESFNLNKTENNSQTKKPKES